MLCKGLILLAISLTVSLAAPAQVTAGRAGVKGEMLGYGTPNGTSDNNGGWLVTGPSQERVDQLQKSSEVRTDIPTSLGGTQGGVVSVTSLAAPKKARASFEKAVKELREGPSAKLDKAMEDLQKAVDAYPAYAAAWTALGELKAQSGDNDGAIVALEKALDADPRYILPYEPLVRLYIGKGDWEHTAELTKFVLSVDPADTKMRWYQAVSTYESGHDEEAVSLLGEIQKDAEDAKQFPQTHHLMGLIHAKRGEYGEAAAAYNRYLELDPNAQATEAIKKQLNEWQQLGVL